MKELTEGDERPEYVFISNYYMHVGATRYLIENGITLGSGIHIASFDDMELNSILGFCRITVAQPMAGIGSSAAALLIDRINGSTSPPRIVRLKTRLEKAEVRNR
jgi:LacI family transcriptional regulator